MTLKEAVASGRRYRLRGREYFDWFGPGCVFGQVMEASIAIADDWEVEDACVCGTIYNCKRHPKPEPPPKPCIVYCEKGASPSDAWSWRVYCDGGFGHEHHQIWLL